MIPAPQAPRLHWWGTLLYPLSLVAVFLGGQLLLGLIGVAADQRAAVAAGPAVLALLLSLPWRLRHGWGSTHPWRSLGVRAPAAAVARALLRGLLKAAGLLAVVLAGLMQIALGACRAGFIASFFPGSVIKGLLAAIGVLLRVGDGSFVNGIIAAALVFAICTACWLRGWMGGGDVKLLAAAALAHDRAAFILNLNPKK